MLFITIDIDCRHISIYIDMFTVARIATIHGKPCVSTISILCAVCTFSYLFYFIPLLSIFLCSAVVSNVKSLSLVNYPNVFRWYANNEHRKKHVFDIWCCFMSFHCRFGCFVVITSLEIDRKGKNQLSFGKMRGNKLKQTQNQKKKIA